MFLPKIFLVFIIFQIEMGDAFIGNVGTTIMDGIKDAFIGLFKAIGNGVISFS